MKYIFVLIGLFNLPWAYADVDVFDAARNGDLAQLETYVQAGGSFNITNEKGYTPFILAAYYDQQAATAFMLEHQAEPCALDHVGNNAFMGVAFKGHENMAKWLLSHTSCSINHRNNAGQTALMMAALFDREALVGLFIEHGADVNAQDYRGNSAESLAAGQGLEHIVDMVRFSLENR